jgi:hypothetical protein
MAGVVYTVAVVGQVIDTSGKLRKVVNSWGYTAGSGSPTPVQLTALADLFLSAVWAPIAARLSAEYRGLTTLVYDDPLTSEGGFDTGKKPADGGQQGARLPLHQAVHVGLRSGRRGLRYVGRKRIGPVMEGDVVGDELNDVAWGAWQGLADGWVDQLETGVQGETWQPVILSRQNSSRGPPAVYDYATLDWATVTREIGLCRHRREREQHQVIGPTHDR